MAEGASYLDVRSVREFGQGHPQGAYNVPLLDHQGGARMLPNQSFVDEVAAVLEAEAPVVVGCKSGARSLRAAEMLQGAGFTSVVDMRGGFSGEQARPGAEVGCKGWRDEGLAVSERAEAGRSWQEIRELAKKG